MHPLVMSCLAESLEELPQAMPWVMCRDDHQIGQGGIKQWL